MNKKQIVILMGLAGRGSGINEEITPPDPEKFLLLEDGGFLMQENGHFILI